MLEEHQKSMKREEAESSINEEDAEFGSLLQNITEEWDEASASHDDQLKQKIEKNWACWNYGEAMETVAETGKRKHRDENSGSKRNYDPKTMVYLKSHTEQESYFKQKRLELRKQELALQQERQEQQQQRNLFQQQMIQ